MEPFELESAKSFLAGTVDLTCERQMVTPSTDFDSLAESWRSLGLDPGELVLIALPNGVSLLQQFFAVLAIQAVPALVSPSIPSSRLLELAASLNARAVVANYLDASRL